MKHIKRFSEEIEFAFDDEISDENQTIDYSEAFEKYVKNQKIISEYEDQPKYNNGQKYYTQVCGVRLENGYSYASHGGGCSGEDCNNTFIINKNNIVIADYLW
jgi:hypothetical protein